MRFIRCSCGACCEGVDRAGRTVTIGLMLFLMMMRGSVYGGAREQGPNDSEVESHRGDMCTSRPSRSISASRSTLVEGAREKTSTEDASSLKYRCQLSTKCRERGKGGKDREQNPKVLLIPSRLVGRLTPPVSLA